MVFKMMLIVFIYLITLVVPALFVMWLFAGVEASLTVSILAFLTGVVTAIPFCGVAGWMTINLLEDG